MQMPQMTFAPVRLLTACTLFIGLAACGENGCGCDPGPPVTEGSGIFVTSDAVRSCDIVFKSSIDEVPKVNFTDVVTGEYVPRAPHVAISFAARSDQPIANQELARAAFTGTGTLELVKAECFDASGTAVSGDVVTLGE